MKIDRISYQKIFPTGMMYLNHKIGVEVQVEKNDDWEDAFNLAKKFVEEMNVKSNPSMGMAMEYYLPTPEQVIQKIEIENKQSATERMLSAINSCTDLKVLESFKLLVKNNPEFQTAYDNKLQSLQK